MEIEVSQNFIENLEELIKEEQSLNLKESVLLYPYTASEIKTLIKSVSRLFKKIQKSKMIRLLKHQLEQVIK